MRGVEEEGLGAGARARDARAVVEHDFGGERVVWLQPAEHHVTSHQAGRLVHHCVVDSSSRQWAALAHCAHPRVEVGDTLRWSLNEERHSLPGVGQGLQLVDAVMVPVEVEPLEPGVAPVEHVVVVGRRRFRWWGGGV